MWSRSVQILKTNRGVGAWKPTKNYQNEDFHDWRFCSSFSLIQLGIEVAKHILLLQPGTFCIYDEKVVEAEDIGRNFHCQSHHIGEATRA